MDAERLEIEVTPGPLRLTPHELGPYVYQEQVLRMRQLAETRRAELEAGP